MKVTYHEAIISFCFDLTDPKARSIPVACLLVGESVEGTRFAASAVVLPGSSLDLDPLSREILADVPQLLKQHVGAVISDLPADAPLEQILRSLHHILRNSLHVAATRPACEIEVAADAWQPRMVGIAVQSLRDALGQLTRQLPASAERELPQHAGTELTSTWPLRPESSGHAAQA